eukprot:1158740-Lingulodinium_polyedra.AAC.1
MACARAMVESSIDVHDGAVLDVAESENGDVLDVDLSDPQVALDAYSKELNAYGMEKSESSSQEERTAVEGKERLVAQLKEAMEARDIGTRS